MIYKLTPTLSDKDFASLLSRFHFEDKDLPMIKHLYFSLLPLLDVKAFCKGNCLTTGISYPNYQGCIITLGKGIDELTTLYLDHQQIAEAYILDCIGLELLAKSYEGLIERIETETGLYVDKLSFLGDEYPLTYLSDLFDVLNPKDMTINDALFLSPSKSASLLLPLTNIKKKDAKELCNTCATCNNLSCPSRKAPRRSLPRTYGNMQIFHA